MLRSAIVVHWIVLAVFVGAANAGITFLDPIPYLSSVDSPFDMSGLGSTFFHEDFEDGIWDLPQGVTAGPYLITPPGAFTDSVDADDGVIDGFGTMGHSMFPNFHAHNFLGPPTWVSSFQMNVESEQLGFMPNAFGLVWTDGVPGSQLVISVRDQVGHQILARAYVADMDPNHAGSTASDVFVGFYADIPFRSITVLNAYSAWTPMYHFEVDHVQFGRVLVPEPGTYFLVTCTFLFGIWRRSRISVNATRSQTKELGHENWKQQAMRSICESRGEY